MLFNLCPLIIWGSPIYHNKQRGTKLTSFTQTKAWWSYTYIFIFLHLHLHPIKHKGMHIDQRDGGGGRSIDSCLSIRMEGRQYTRESINTKVTHDWIYINKNTSVFKCFLINPLWLSYYIYISFKHQTKDIAACNKFLNPSPFL